MATDPGPGGPPPDTSAAEAYANYGGVWKPRFEVFLGPGVQDPTYPPDLQVYSALTAKCQKNNFYQADRFSCTFALWQYQEEGPDFWSSFDSLSVLIKIGFPDNGVPMTEVFRGFADKVQLDFVKGVVTLSGRNTLCLLIDEHMNVTHRDETIGDVLKAAFEKAHMAAPIFEPGFPADQPWGRYYNDVRTSTSTGAQSQINPMDLAMSVCQQVGATMWEVEGVVHFGMGDGGKYYVVIAPQPTYEGGVTKLSPSNATSLVVEHDLEFSQWTHQIYSISAQPNGKNDLAKYPEEDNLADNGVVKKPHFLYLANRTPEDNAQHAHAAYNEMMYHEWIVTYKVAGPQILDMSPQDKVEVVGTGDIIDGGYQIMSIEHQISFDRGYQGIVKGQWGKTDNGVNA